MTFTRGKFLLYGGVTLLAGLVYVNALHNPFVYDDYHTVEANPSLKSVIDIPAIVRYDVKRPIVNFSYALDRAVWGPEPFGFHVTNVLLHMLNVLLLFSLGSRLIKSDAAAGTAAAIFAVHPMMTEAVGYISGRSEVLCATLLLAAFWCGTRWIRGDGRTWAWMTAGWWIAAVATKEVAVMFPVALFWYDWFVACGPAFEARRRLYRVYVPLILIAGVAAGVRVAVFARIENPGQVSLHWPYALLALDVVRRYLALLCFPSGQTVFHAVSPVDGFLAPRALAAFAVVGGLLAFVWWARRRDPVMAFGVLWFLLMLVPSAVLTMLDQGEPMAEHRIYAASVGLFLAVGAGIKYVTARLPAASGPIRTVTLAALALVLAALSMETVIRNRVWSDPILLWQESVNLAPNHFHPRLLLGETLLAAGRPDEAAEQFRTAIHLRPEEPLGYVKLGGYLASTGQLPEARAQFLEAMRRDPKNAAAREGLRILDRITGTPPQ